MSEDETIKIYFDPDTGETFMKIDGMPPQKCENVTKDLIKLQGMKDAKVTQTQQYEGDDVGGSRGESIHRG
jgi:hypothetical protein|tara:strand:- start:1868 stop:2080 length:213 start_codon:yes stop_codon:yes gene_type:complete